MDRELRPVPVSVVVCARNRETVIARCLVSVRSANPSEIIVVDGRSSDRTRQIAAEHGARVVSDGGAGLGAARQQGAEVAREDYIVFVDSDSVVLPDTLQQLYREAVTGSWDALEVRLLPFGADLSYWQRGEAWRRGVQEKTGPAPALGCHVTLIRRQLLLEVGFDKSFTGAGEDSDFYFRAGARGASVGRTDAAIAYHEDRKSFLDFAKQRFWHGRGLGRVIVRHPHTYRRSATAEADSASSGLAVSPRYIPFLAVSIWFLALGVAIETTALMINRRRLSTLRSTPVIRG
jgi:glycosyltransferase involved in cell wall biosynthesis